MTEPTFRNQTYSQVIDIVNELKLKWNYDNKYYIEHAFSYKTNLDVYVTGEYMYVTKTKTK